MDVNLPTVSAILLTEVESHVYIHVPSSSLPPSPSLPPSLSLSLTSKEGHLNNKTLSEGHLNNKEGHLNYIAPYPGSRKRAWYTLFAHVHNRPGIPG